MKKFLSIIFSLTLLFNLSNVSFAKETSEEDFMLHQGIFPFLFNSANKFYNTTSGVLGKVVSGVEQFGQIGFRLSGISYGLTALSSFGLIGKNLYKKFKLKFSKINQDINTVLKELDRELECIKGQEIAKKRMKAIVAAIIDERNEAKEKNKPYNKGDVIYILGPSGVGKTFSSECLSRAIMGKNAEPIRIDSSCFDKVSNISLKSQILYMRDQQKNNGGLSYNYVDNSIASKIASNPNIVLIFDEYDKWCTPETDEMLRTIMDKGVIYRDGERIDCSKLLVIVISNEDHSSITLGNGQGIFQDDGTGSRTYVVHDKSFLNRLNVVEFDNLYENEYEEITLDQLENISERYKKLYSIQMDFGDTAKNIAKKVAKMNQGAREIAKILGNLRKELIIEKQKSMDLFKNKKLIIDYNPENDEFTIE